MDSGTNAVHSTGEFPATMKLVWERWTVNRKTGITGDKSGVLPWLEGQGRPRPLSTGKSPVLRGKVQSISLLTSAVTLGKSPISELIFFICEGGWERSLFDLEFLCFLFKGKFTFR